MVSRTSVSEAKGACASGVPNSGDHAVGTAQPDASHHDWLAFVLRNHKLAKAAATKGDVRCNVVSMR